MSPLGQHPLARERIELVGAREFATSGTASTQEMGKAIAEAV